MDGWLVSYKEDRKTGAEVIVGGALNKHENMRVIYYGISQSQFWIEGCMREKESDISI